MALGCRRSVCPKEAAELVSAVRRWLCWVVPAAGQGRGRSRPPARVRPLRTSPGIRRGSGTVCSREYAVTFANVAVGVRAVGILYSQTMICGMKTGVFQLKIKMSA